ncbi:unnamed protein product [Hermetia illucens]|uniref:Uncharacterized protein n=1 Tax=Hermetia illucens TaxID=343691 RepID=A0A7R8UZ63_HERIL|nr:unnamed protein product [Hermetia illucens]
MPFAINIGFQILPAETTVAFGPAMKAQCLLLYVISVATFIGRLTNQQQTVDILNEHTKLTEILQSVNSYAPKHTLLFILISLKCILPVNQLTAMLFVILTNNYFNVSINLANSVLIFCYGQLFVIVNTWSLRNISCQLLYDTVNDRLFNVFNNLKHQGPIRRQRFNFSSGVILCNDFTVPFAINIAFQTLPVEATVAFGPAMKARCLLLYVVSVATFIGQLTNQQQTVDILNEHTNLTEILQSVNNHALKHTLLFVLISLKCILPVNQLTAILVVTLANIHFNVWMSVAISILIFCYGQLFVIVNTWSLRNISCRLLYDTINDRLFNVFNNLKHQGPIRKQRFNFSSGLILCNDCKFSAAIDELMDLNSAIYLSVSRISCIAPAVRLGVVTVLFINNIFGLYQCYYLLQLALTTVNFKTIAISVQLSTKDRSVKAGKIYMENLTPFTVMFI